MSTSFVGYAVDKNRLFEFCHALKADILGKEMFVRMCAIEENEIEIHVYEVSQLSDKYIVAVYGAGYYVMNNFDKYKHILSHFYYEDRSHDGMTEEEVEEMEKRLPAIEEIGSLVRIGQYLTYTILSVSDANYKIFVTEQK